MFKEQEPMKSALIVVGGDLKMNPKIQAIIDEADYILAADAGIEHCLNHKIIPDLVVGDFDSASSRSIEIARKLNWNIETFPKEKDKTDGELALLKALEWKAKKIWIVGGLSGKDRFDHGIGNIFLLTSERLESTLISMIDGNREIHILRSRQSIQLEGEIGDTISMISVELETQGVTSWGLKYDLLGISLSRGSTRGISNSFVWAKAEVSISKGLLLIIIDRKIN
jgi:thiamine pyrophosphokinase